ncbi:hypothetical protein M513_13911 [Trichuris suis]|uniref:ISXO2-like transposase domain-containing protein n=1 Tax=Trichuris suis TaxID=68888 RepID=A0A085LJR6_9BILA|nr:hypothetical protein M513_13911 [Trichuris suis]
MFDGCSARLRMRRAQQLFCVRKARSIRKLCPSCSDLMQLGCSGKVRRCYKRSCREEVSIRTGTCFEGRRGRFKLQNPVDLMFFWSRGYNSMKVCSDELGINKNVTSRWNRHIREVAAEALAELPVEVRQWQTVRHSPVGVQGHMPESGQSSVLPVENRLSGTLLLIVKRHVKPGTTVVTDDWRGYRFLTREAYTHMRVNQFRTFVNRAIHAHSQSIESLCSQAKRKQVQVWHPSELAAAASLQIHVEEKVGMRR